MTYKATFKDYLITGLVFGTAFGVLMFLLQRSAAGAIAGGLTYGILFPAIMSLFGKSAENRAKEIRLVLSQSHRITCEGVAKLNGRPGWMFLCEDALVYYLNDTPQPIVLHLSQIRGVALVRNRLVIHTQTGSFQFIVAKNKQWQASILQSMNTQII